MVKEFIFRIFISIISYCLVRMPYLLAFIHVRILISNDGVQWNITRVSTLVSSYDGITSLFMCSSVSEAWKVFWDSIVKSYLLTFIEWISISIRISSYMYIGCIHKRPQYFPALRNRYFNNFFSWSTIIMFICLEKVHFTL